MNHHQLYISDQVPAVYQLLQNTSWLKSAICWSLMSVGSEWNAAMEISQILNFSCHGGSAGPQRKITSRRVCISIRLIDYKCSSAFPVVLSDASGPDTKLMSHLASSQHGTLCSLGGSQLGNQELLQVQIPATKYVLNQVTWEQFQPMREDVT